MFTVNALRNAAKLLEKAANAVATDDPDNLEYADECVARALAELENAEYDLENMIEYARTVA